MVTSLENKVRKGLSITVYAKTGGLLGVGASLMHSTPAARAEDAPDT